MAIEIERKYLDVDLDTVRGRLKSLRGRSLGPHFENNVVYDINDNQLLRTGKLLRLRLREWAAGEDCILTFKTHIDSSHENAKSCKMREELELEVESGQVMDAILCKLGYNPVARYEKVRETWYVNWPPDSQQESGAEMKIDLDVLPFCEVIEIEGDPAKMDDLAQSLGLDKMKISTKTYHELHQKWLAANNLPPTPSFVFEAAEKKKLKAFLGL